MVGIGKIRSVLVHMTKVWKDMDQEWRSKNSLKTAAVLGDDISLKEVRGQGVPPTAVMLSGGM